MSLRATNFARKKGYTIELQAIIARANTEGFTLPGTSTLSALDIFIRAMKTAGFWQKMDLINVFSMNDTSLVNFCRINMVNPTGTMGAVVGTLTYNVNGIKGAGNSSNYWSTGINPFTSGKYLVSSASRTFVISEAGTGQIDGNTSFSESCRNGSTTEIRVACGSGGVLTSSIDISGVGFKSLNRTTSLNTANNISVILGNTTNLRQSNSVGAVGNATQFIHRGDNTQGGNTVIGFYSLGSSVVLEAEAVRLAYKTFLNSIGLTTLSASI